MTDLYRQPIPQGTAPPEPGAIYTGDPLHWLVKVEPDHPHNTTEDLQGLLMELLSYANPYFVDKWDLQSQVDAWVAALGVNND